MTGRGDDPLIPGRASAAGTARFAERFAHLPGHFRSPDRLSFSSIALGTRRGDPGGADDLLIRSAVSRCLELGVNVFDTALSDRFQTSERAVGVALRRGLAEGAAARDEVVVVTKGGALIPDPDFTRDTRDAQRYLYSTYVDTGLVDPSRVVDGHSLEPAFLRDQIRRSRSNLGLETLDLYLLEQPELFLRAFGPNGFREHLALAMRALEGAVSDGEIAAYGLCTWDGLLVPHTERGHLAIADVLELALDVGGADHHLRALQLPYGLAMGEGAILASQLAPEGHSSAVLDALAGTGTAVLVSAPLYGGRVLGHIPGFVREAFPEASTDAQCCLQFVRSTAQVTSAVVGMRHPDHVEENLALAAVAPADPAIPASLFRKAAEA